MGLASSGIMPPMKYWEIIAKKLCAAGWSWGYCSDVTRDGWRWTVHAHKKRKATFVESDELLTAFPKFEATQSSNYSTLEAAKHKHDRFHLPYFNEEKLHRRVGSGNFAPPNAPVAQPDRATDF